ncbi:MAG: glycosyltransferase family 4 protein [Planctomycetia bacterium]|nr:glycosyltransferase family 4 protein [Planctomycetia bacterium]
MRIAHIITRLIIGGAQENTLFTCEDLSTIHGDDVLLIAGPPEGPEGSLVRRARNGPYRFEEIRELCRSVLPWNDLVAYVKIRRLLRRFQPDVVHTHSAKAGILGRLAASSLRVPVIVHGIHGTPFHPEQSRLAHTLIRMAERRAAGWCNAFVSVADAMNETFLREGIVRQEELAEKPMFTIRSGMEVGPFLGCDVHRSRMRARYGFRETDVVVGKIARLFRLKGHDDLITAAIGVRARFPETGERGRRIRFLLVGDGVLHDTLRARISSLGLSEMFVFAGLVPPEEIPSIISAMDMVVHTSLREGLARVLPQALIAARPVISYDIDGAREVCIPGETGFLIPPRETDRITDAICQLADDPALRRRYGETGRRRFTEVFRHEHMTEEIRQVYAQLSGRRRNRSEA